LCCKCTVFCLIAKGLLQKKIKQRLLCCRQRLAAVFSDLGDNYDQGEQRGQKIAQGHGYPDAFQSEEAGHYDDAGN